MANFYYKIGAIITIAVLIAMAVMVVLPNKFQLKERVESADSTGSLQVEFVIEGGQSLSATAHLLAKRNLIISRYIFVIYSVISGNERTFKAGKYVVSPSASIVELVRKFSSGDVKNEDIGVTIPEGTNIADVDRLFSEAGLIRLGDILSYSSKYGGILTLEGFFFPDTYRFKRPETRLFTPPEEIIKKMSDNFNYKTRDFLPGWFTGDGTSNRERLVIIVASILEKEVKTESDMRLVAGIIEKRLSLGMPLELDATVAYGVCYPKFLAGKYCDVSLANIVDNISIDSVYNTYKRDGLPIGPISNPGLRAIRAAINPQSSDYIFYLSAKDGTTIFSRTAAEHLKARRKYLE